MLRFTFVYRSVPIVARVNCKWCSSVAEGNTDSDILELKIINHLYPWTLEPPHKLTHLDGPTTPEWVSNHTPLTPEQIFHKSVEMIGTRSKRRNQNLSLVSEAALSHLRSPSLSPLDRHLLLVSAALSSRGTSRALHPAILSGLEGCDDACKDIGCTLRLLFVAGLTRLRLPPASWRSVQRRLSERAALLSEADLVALSSASFRCGAPVTSSRLQERLVNAACRLATADGHMGSLVALLKALRLARVPSAPLLAALRGLVARRGARLSLPAAAHLAACWCAPPVRDAPLLAALERRLVSALESPPSGSEAPPPPIAVPDGRPKDVSRLLYAFSHLGHVPGRRALQLTECHMAGWPPRQPLLLVDALLSLATQGRYPDALLRRALTVQVAEQLAGACRPRQLSRLALLHLAASLETSLRLPSLSRVLTPAALPAPSLARELRRRPRLAQLLERLQRRQPGARVTLGYPVPHVNVASVLLSWPDGRRAAVELLDGGALLRTPGDGLPAAGDVAGERCGGEAEHGASVGPSSAVGLVRLKARLAEKLGYKVHWESELGSGSAF